VAIWQGSHHLFRPPHPKIQSFKGLHHLTSFVQQIPDDELALEALQELLEQNLMYLIRIPDDELALEALQEQNLMYLLRILDTRPDHLLVLEARLSTMHLLHIHLVACLPIAAWQMAHRNHHLWRQRDRPSLVKDQVWVQTIIRGVAFVLLSLLSHQGGCRLIQVLKTNLANIMVLWVVAPIRNGIRL
jgi:hypothetical protein